MGAVRIGGIVGCMRVGRIGYWTWASAAVGIATVRVSIAESTSRLDRVRITYEAPANCPDRAALLAKVSERVSIAWLADETESARHIHVSIEPNDDEFVGTMQYVDDAGHQVVRSLKAPDCEQALTGVALVTAMAVEAQVAQPTPTETERNDNPQTPPAPTVRVGPTADATRERRNAGVARAPSAAQSSGDSRARSAFPWSGGGEPRSSTQELGAVGGIAKGIGPGRAWGLGVLWGIGGESFPSFRLVANWYEDHEASTLDTIALRFRVISAVPQLCGRAYLPQGRTLGGGFCVGFELGQYQATGVATGPTQTHQMLWASAQLALPLRLEAGSAFIEVIPVMRFPLVAGSFETQHPTRTVHEVPRVALGIEGVLGLKLP